MYVENWKKIFYSILKKKSNSFIQSLLDVGFDINALNNKGTTMLSYAAECGNLEIIEFLVQNGADSNVTNSDGTKPLHMAAMYGHKDIAKFFINLGVFVDSCDNKKWTPLHYAVKETSLRTVDNYLELAQFLVDSNADLNAANRDGRTPLLLAVQNSPKALVDLLIKLGADVECCDKSQGTLLHYSARRGWLETVRSLVEGGSHIDLDAKTSRGHTPLILAAESSHKDIIKLLIESGANIECKSFEAWTVLHYACAFGWLDLVEYLVNKGCDLNGKSFNAFTPLLLAAKYSHFNIVEYLLKSGANDKYTALHFACGLEWSDLVVLLIKKGCDLNAQECKKGDTPLHIAAETGNLKIMEHLLKAGADYNVKNFKRIRAFHCLMQRCICLKGIILFLENGAYFQPDDYAVISEKLLLKSYILQNVELCTLSVINKFNNVELPKIYEIPVVAERLPPFKKMKIVHNTKVAQDFAQTVKYEIQTNGYCNVLNVCPIVLKMLCVRSLVEHYNKLHIMPSTAN